MVQTKEARRKGKSKSDAPSDALADQVMDFLKRMGRLEDDVYTFAVEHGSKTGGDVDADEFAKAMDPARRMLTEWASWFAYTSGWRNPETAQSEPAAFTSRRQ